MTFMKYEIKSDDTLQSIAHMFGKDLKELLVFHNQNSNFTQHITGDYIPIHVNFLIINDSETQNNKGKIPAGLDFTFFANASYAIEISTSLYYMGKPISKNTIESIWTTTFDKSSRIIKVQVSNRKNVEIDNQVAPLLELIEKINKTTEYLELQLNEDLTVAEVANLDSVLKKWEFIKFNELKVYELEDDYFKVIIAAYENEFKNLIESLKMNILYQIFFHPQGYSELQKGRSRSIAENVKTASQLFPQQHIYYDLNCKNEILEDGFQINSNSSKPNSFNTNNLESEFKKNYSQLLKEPFDFNFFRESQYIYNEDGSFLHGKTYIKEQASKELFYIGEYVIKK